MRSSAAQRRACRCEGNDAVKLYRPDDFTGNKAWDALDIERFDAATVRLHWTDKSYIWHVNDGPEVFILLTGSVRMHYRDANGVEDFFDMVPGDAVHCREGDNHKAEPLVPSRIMVIESPGSI